MNAIIAGIGVGILLIILSWILSRSSSRRNRFIYYPGFAGFIGGVVLLICSLLVIGGWEGIGYAFFAVPVILISGLLLLVLASYRRQT
ncbi:YesK family protein [Paenibacillus sp. MMS20-IR301]|uniref:YesK family protein n=1 Tax=Paenibacillus sp. MMS20-IR301 TaxID=2895946 RepID=UPI0028E25B91|nr:YesK family protein [Paenibacillus sp. MMS20-IR301]WNS42077.1 YesK family protein [Paenibacillus sp. MMS20-IR301]